MGQPGFCCRECNLRKGDRTPEEAEMPFYIFPALSIHTSRYLLRLVGLEEDGKWAPYLLVIGLTSSGDFVVVCIGSG